MPFDITIGLDVGLDGGISILEGDNMPKVYKIPTETVVVSKKKKRKYDIQAICDILSPYQGKNVLFVQETVGTRSGEGAVSAFGFGKSSGITLGIAYAYGFEVAEAHPLKWKKDFPDLNSGVILEFREEVKKLRAKKRGIEDKIKGECSEKQNKREINKLIKNEQKKIEKEISRISSQVKREAKKNARGLISSLFPDISDLFKKVNSDGMAESLLIALFGRKHANELVREKDK